MDRLLCGVRPILTNNLRSQYNIAVFTSLRAETTFVLETDILNEKQISVFFQNTYPLDGTIL